MRYASVCDGIGAVHAAWHPLGWECVFTAEIEPYPATVVAHRYGLTNLGDMTAIDGAAWRGKIDLLAGGTPCQSFSVAGNRGSLADVRGNLTLKFVELANEIDPAWIVWENVPGVLSTRDNAFGCFLGGLAGADVPAVTGYRRSAEGVENWPAAGLVVGPRRAVGWRVLDAQHFGLPQRRRRVFVVAFQTPDVRYPAAVLFEPESLRRDTPPSPKARPEIACALTGSTGSRRNCPGDNCVARSLTASNSGQYLDGTVEPFVADGQPLNAIAGDVYPTLPANATPPVLAFSCKDDGGDAGEVSPPLRSFSMATVVVSETGPITHALPASHGASPDGTGRGVPIVAGFKRGQGAAARSIGYAEEMCPTLTASDSGTQTPPGVQIGETVRRLTPVECERLQGFPDGYTDIPWGRPKCPDQQCPDSPRYKALGNSMAVPVIRWLGRRIDKVQIAADVKRVATGPSVESAGR